MKVRLLGGVEGRSSNVSPERCINLYYEVGENGESLVNTPGDAVFASLGAGEIRGSIDYNNKAYVVKGNTLYEVNSSGTSVSRGTLNTSSGRVSMAHNGTRAGANQQIFIADGTQRYIYDNTTSTLTGYTDYAAVTVVFIDGYFLFNVKNTDRFFLTSLYDGVTVDPLDFETAEGGPDKIQSLVADQRELFVFGEDSLEVFYNSGDTDNTFQRFQGGFKQVGCAAAFTPVRINNNICWLTSNERGHGQIAQLGEGYLPSIISIPELDYQIAQYTTISDAFAYAYQIEGHECYVITFPSEGKTWAYDMVTQKWHQRGHVINSVFPNRERYNSYVFAFNKHLFGDLSNGNLYELDSSSGTSNSERIPRELVTPNISEEEMRLRISEAQLDMQEGTGDPNVATDTSIWMSWSKDGGHTYSNEIERSIGDTGEYKHRIRWKKLGWARNWTFKIRTWTPNRVVMKGLYLRPYGS